MNDIRQIVNHYFANCPIGCKIPDKFWECSFRHPELAKALPKTEYTLYDMIVYKNHTTTTTIQMNVCPTDDNYGRVTCTHMHKYTFEICDRQLNDINDDNILIIRDYIGKCKQCH